MLRLAVVYGFAYRWDRCTVTDDTITFVKDADKMFVEGVPRSLAFTPYLPARAT